MLRTRSIRLAVVAAVCVGLTSLAGPVAATTGHQIRGERIAYEVTDPATGYISVALVNPDGTGEAALTVPFAAGRPRWSPDGRRLLLFTFTDVGLRPSTVRPDGSDFSALAVPYFSPDVDVSPCIWAPQGRILCEARSYGNNPDPALNGIYSIRLSDGRVVRRLTVNPYPPSGNFGGGDLPGSVSPNGTKFVFKRAKPGPEPTPDLGQSGALFVENLDGSGLRQITDYGLANSHDEGVAQWSPDGRTILFGGEDGGLYLIQPNGHSLRKINLKVPDDRYFAFAPSWSPDGSRIIFALGLPSAQRVDIYSAKANGKDLRQVTNSPEFDDFPDWGKPR